MLKTRILTASLLLPLAITGILYLPNQQFSIISGCIFILGLWEWSQLAGFHSRLGRGAAVIAMPFFILALLALIKFINEPRLKEVVPSILVTFWSLAAIFLYRYPRDCWLWKTRFVGILSGALVLVPSWGMLVALQHQDPKLVLYLLSIIWIADSAAYFTGKRFGLHKLAKEVSPGKSWEGVAGALVATIACSMLGHFYLKPNVNLYSWVLLSLFSVSFSIVGDLFESAFKRMRNMKDSGKLLPGHGGVMDRIDSLTAAIPMFTIGLVSVV